MTTTTIATGATFDDPDVVFDTDIDIVAEIEADDEFVLHQLAENVEHCCGGRNINCGQHYGRY